MQSAQNAAKAAEGSLDVRVVDSRSITSGLGTQVLLAAQAGRRRRVRRRGGRAGRRPRRRTHVFGALDTLDNLKKGGRIGGAQALLGSLLSIKPIVDISTGKVEEAGKARTRKKALEVLRDKVAEAGAIEHLCVTHGFAPELDDMLDLLAPLYPRDQIRVGRIGPVIGTHGGPRVMGVTWIEPLTRAPLFGAPGFAHPGHTVPAAPPGGCAAPRRSALVRVSEGPGSLVGL